MLVFYFQMFLGGLTFPPEMLPSFLQHFIQICNPIVYGLYLMRAAWFGDGTLFDVAKDVGILLGVALALMVATKNKRKNGAV
jgi:ABC-2 type transport system permease protein